MALTEQLALVVSMDPQKAVKGLTAIGKSVDKNLGNTDSRVANTALKFQGLGIGMLGAGGAIAAGFGVAVGAAMNFDKQISELGAVTGATGDQMSELRDQALEAGAATSFSASEAATAQTELAKAGVSTADIMGGALTGALDLAAAGSLDLGRAAEIAATSMTTFGLAGTDVTMIADTLAAGANKSASSVEEISQGLAQSGLVADQFGITLQETVGALSLFAQNGLRGSDAGTSFKSMLQRLNPSSKEAADKMEELGIDLYDAQGNFIGLAETAEVLKTSFQRLTPEARASALNVIFGSDAIRAASILYQEGAAGVDEWTMAVDDAGYAGELAAKKLDNLSGDLEALRGSIETALIKTGSGANGALRFMVQGATDAVNAFAGLPGPVQTAGTALAGIGSAALIGAGGLITIIPKIRESLDALSGMGPAGAKAAGALGKLGKLGGAVGGIAAVTGGLVILHGVLEDVFTEDAPKVDRMTAALVEFARESAITGALADAFGDDLKGLGDDLDLLDDRRSGFHIDLAEDFDEAVARIDSLDKALAGLVSSGHAEMAEELFASITRGMKASQIEQLENELNDYDDALVNAETSAKLAGDATGEMGTDMTSASEDVEAATEALSGYADQLKSLTDPIFAAQNAQAALGEAQNAVTEAIKEHGRHSPEAIQANRELTEAAADYESALFTLEQGVINGTVTQDAYTTALQRWADQGYITQGAADQAAWSFGILKGSADKVPESVGINVTTPGLNTAITNVNYLIGRLGVMQGTYAAANIPSADLLYGGGRASGGPVMSGMTYTVGEKGPELLTMGSSSGYITPNEQWSGGGGSQTIVIQVGDRVLDELVQDSMGRIESKNGAVRVRTRAS